MPKFKALAAGDPAPWFRQRSSSNPVFSFDTIAGRYIVLGFFASTENEMVKEAVASVSASPLFDDMRACFFGVSVDPVDETRVAERIPGLRWFWDFDGAISRLYGALALDDNAYRRMWVVLDPTLRIIAVMPWETEASYVSDMLTLVAGLPPPDRHTGGDSFPPVLMLPNVLEPDLCQTLIGLYEAHGGEESGFMREIDGRTVLVHDRNHKRRRDYLIEDRALVVTLQERVRRRIVPEIAKAHQFHVTRMERYLVGCYTAADGGHFRAHRDNTTKGTAHRRFAVSINLNSEFEGGELCFPEYGRRMFKPPPGGAVVFSCSLLHAASVVTSGVRYAFLPFLYDDAAAALREKNNEYLGDGVGEYRKGA
jgi:peroxiredoxin